MTENKTQKKQKAKKLMQKYGLSHALAYSVVNNDCSLHEALVESRKRLELEIAAEKHQLTGQEQRELLSGEKSLFDIAVR